MAYFEDLEEWQSNQSENVLVNQAHVPVGMYQTVTTKIPPTYDGRTSWFSYEEAIDDWCDITELDPEKRAPALRNRLDGDAAIYKSLLDRDLLRGGDQGVNYFKRTLRQHFVKGNQSIFLWRFFQLFRATRGQYDILRWIGRFQVVVKKGIRRVDGFT